MWTTLASICRVSAPRRERLPPETLRLTTAGRSDCSARQLVASTLGSNRKPKTAGSSIARCAAKRCIVGNEPGAMMRSANRLKRWPRAIVAPCAEMSPAFRRSCPRTSTRILTSRCGGDGHAGHDAGRCGEPRVASMASARPSRTAPPASPRRFEGFAQSLVHAAQPIPLAFQLRVLFTQAFIFVLRLLHLAAQPFQLSLRLTDGCGLRALWHPPVMPESRRWYKQNPLTSYE